MTAELTIRSWASFAKGGLAANVDSGVLNITVAGPNYMKTVQSVGTAEEAIQLGEVNPAGAWCWIVNRDLVNYVQIKVGTGGSIIQMLQPGDVSSFRFDLGVTAPCIIAHTAAVVVEFLIVPA